MDENEIESEDVGEERIQDYIWFMFEHRKVED